MTSHILPVFFMALILLATFQSKLCASMAPLCEPGIIEAMPGHIRNMCFALENSDQLSSVLRGYIQNEAAGKESNLEKISNMSILEL